MGKLALQRFNLRGANHDPLFHPLQDQKLTELQVQIGEKALITSEQLADYERLPEPSATEKLASEELAELKSQKVDFLEALDKALPKRQILADADDGDGRNIPAVYEWWDMEVEAHKLSVKWWRKIFKTPRQVTSQ